MTVSFGDCRLDLGARRLFKGARELHMSPKAFALLQALIEARPQALSKTELLESVWPGVFVSDASLAKAVSEIRELTGDQVRNGQIVRTVHGYGYAFVASVVHEELKGPSAAPRMVYQLISSTRNYFLWEGRHIIGREPDALVSLDSPKVSRRHARLTLTGNRVTVEDLGSKNGTFVRGVRISVPTAVQPGDHIEIGPVRLTLSKTATTETDVGTAPAGDRRLNARPWGAPRIHGKLH